MLVSKRVNIGLVASHFIFTSRSHKSCRYDSHFLPGADQMLRATGCDAITQWYPKGRRSGRQTTRTRPISRRPFPRLPSPALLLPDLVPKTGSGLALESGMTNQALEVYHALISQTRNASAYFTVEALLIPFRCRASISAFTSFTASSKSLDGFGGSPKTGSSPASVS